MLTKKDYKLIAKAVEDSHLSVVDKRVLVSNMCRLFVKDNARFNSELFIEACYHNDDHGRLTYTKDNVRLDS
ncbi:MAG: hypothetical protein NVS9B9_31090 [Ktedonobacteraceae bacterium]